MTFWPQIPFKSFVTDGPWITKHCSRDVFSNSVKRFSNPQQLIERKSNFPLKMLPSIVYLREN